MASSSSAGYSDLQSAYHCSAFHEPSYSTAFDTSRASPSLPHMLACFHESLHVDLTSQFELPFTGSSEFEATVDSANAHIASSEYSTSLNESSCAAATYSAAAPVAPSSSDSSAASSNFASHVPPSRTALHPCMPAFLPAAADLEGQPFILDIGPSGPDWQLSFESLLRIPVAKDDAAGHVAKLSAIRRLAHAFATTASRIARVIVEQCYLPAAARTFQPVSGMGIAGGEKYIANNMFFKLVRDIHGIYGGDTGAAKAAKQEIRSLEALVALNVEGVLFPLMCLVDYLGLRIICTSIIPGVGATTQCYGTADAGRTIAAREPLFNQRMFQIARRLNLAAHNVIARSTGVVHVLPSAADVEGHVVEANGSRKFYMLDFGRLFPPSCPGGGLSFLQADKEMVVFMASGESHFAHESFGTMLTPVFKTASAAAAAVAAPLRLESIIIPDGVLTFNRRASAGCDLNAAVSALVGFEVRGNAILTLNHGQIFYRFLRPNAVASAGGPALSSDAFSAFGCCQRCLPLPGCNYSGDAAGASAGPCAHTSTRDNENVSETTRRFFSTRLDELARRIDRREITPTDGQFIVDEMHAAGINLRMLGHLRHAINQVEFVRDFILTEMVSRTVRVRLQAQLRRALQTAGSRIDGAGAGAGADAVLSACKAAVVAVLNQIFGSSAASTAFWDDELLLGLKAKFGNCLRQSETLVGARASMSMLALFARLQRVSGVRFAASTVAALFDDPERRFSVAEPFTVADIECIEVRTRVMDVETSLNREMYASSIARIREQAPAADPSPVAAGEVGAADFASFSVSSAGAQARSPQLMAESTRAITRWDTLFQRELFGTMRRALGADHPDAIAAAFKVAMQDAHDANQKSAALALARESLSVALALNPHSQLVLIGNIAVGTMLANAGEARGSIAYFRAALSLAEKLVPKHPIVGRVCCHIGRNMLASGARADAVGYLQRAFRLYESIYGKTAVDYVVPLITMGKGEEMALSLGAFAHQIKDIAETDAEAKALFERLTASVHILEDIEGLARGYFFGRSLALSAPPPDESDEHQYVSIDLNSIGAVRDAMNAGPGACASEQAIALSSTDASAVIQHYDALIEAGALTRFIISSESTPSITVTSPSGVISLCTVATTAVGQAVDSNALLSAEADAGSSSSCSTGPASLTCYAAIVCPTEAGAHRVLVTVGGTDRVFSLLVKPSKPCAPRCRAFFDGAMLRAGAEPRGPVTIGTTHKVRIELFDAFGNATSRGDTRVSFVFQCGGIRLIETEANDLFDANSKSNSAELELKLTAVFDEGYLDVLVGGRTVFRASRSSLYFKVIAPTGTGFCNNRLSVGFSSAGALVCQRCAIQHRTETMCARCKTPCSGTMRRSARYIFICIFLRRTLRV